MPVDVFISYAHADAQHLEELLTHLALLRRKKQIRAWTDREITAGDAWHGEIDAALDSAGLVLMLVSPDFVASDFCWDVELRHALERRAASATRVVPIIVRPADWQDSALGQLQALPKGARPVTRWPDRDEAWLDVVRGLRRLLDDIEHVHPDGSILVRVPAGAYPLGTADFDPASGPPRTVELESFQIGKLPVTNKLYSSFLDAKPGHRRPLCWADNRFNDPEQPVVGVSWDDAAAYCDWAGLHLPSEARWEAAARGPRGRRFPWGDDEPTARRAIFGRTTRAPVTAGTLPEGAGPFGTLDQAGNVREWCADPWADDPALRVVRGGAWDDPAWKLRPAYRAWAPADERSRSVGFRVALAPD